MLNRKLRVILDLRSKVSDPGRAKLFKGNGSWMPALSVCEGSRLWSLGEQYLEFVWPSFRGAGCAETRLVCLLRIGRSDLSLD